MKIAYADCFSGVSGDMLLGAIVDSGTPLAKIKSELARLPVKGYRITAKKVMKGAIQATKVTVKIDDHEHKHGHDTHLTEILGLIKRSRLSEKIKKNASSIFKNLAEAEGKVHGISPAKVHFHEVGAIDSIVDIVGACIGLDLLGVEKLYCSRIPLSYGTARCAHGTFPVPGPATLELLRGFPVCYLDIGRELVTPTGAAILTTLSERVGKMPSMIVRKSGYGAGGADLDQRPNIFRLIVGEAESDEETDLAWVVETNLDNISGEVVGYLYDRLFSAGALDVYTTPIQMKKSRPAIKLSVIAPPGKLSAVQRIILEETPTFGLRRYLVERTKLRRDIIKVKTPYGVIRVKIGRNDDGVAQIHPEYEDCRGAAMKYGVAISVVVSSATQGVRRPGRG